MRSANSNENQIAFPLYPYFFYYHNGTLFLNAFIYKCRKVVSTKKQLRCLPHFFYIETITYPPDEFFRKGGPASGNLIEIVARNGIVAWVKGRTRLLYLQNVDVGWQALI